MSEEVLNIGGVMMTCEDVDSSESEEESEGEKEEIESSSIDVDVGLENDLFGLIERLTPYYELFDRLFGVGKWSINPQFISPPLIMRSEDLEKGKFFCRMFVNVTMTINHKDSTHPSSLSTNYCEEAYGNRNAHLINRVWKKCVRSAELELYQQYFHHTLVKETKRMEQEKSERIELERSRRFEAKRRQMQQQQQISSTRHPQQQNRQTHRNQRQQQQQQRQRSRNPQQNQRDDSTMARVARDTGHLNTTIKNTRNIVHSGTELAKELQSDYGSIGQGKDTVINVGKSITGDFEKVTTSCTLL